MAARKVLTVEEALALPPPTAEELEQRRKVLLRVKALNDATLKRRHGVPIPWEEIELALHRGERDDDHIPVK
jgi:hypothetical protein